ncbi:MAG: hypothetical protein GX369_06090 [Euryarchaeota archaeon]|nr:hypothetical protein [Euryarchaeota archaeon]
MKGTSKTTGSADKDEGPKRLKREMEAEEPLSQDDVVMDLDMIAEEVIFGKNPARTYALREVWYSSLKELISDPTVPDEAREEVMFLSLTNALLDMLMDVVPKEMALTFARNLDDYLAVTLVNKEYDIDLLKTFQDEFADAMGDDFQSEEQLMESLESFENEWWDNPRDELKGKSPNEALEEMADKHEL